MLHERHTRESRTEWIGLVLALVGAAVLGTLAGTPVSDTAPGRIGSTRIERNPSLSDRLSAVDTAVAAGDRTRAARAWREAYGLALRTRAWDAMAAVGDAALRVDTLAGPDGSGVSSFRAEARRAYLIALFRARDAGVSHGVARVAEAFSGLGDDQVAARARAIPVEAGR
jgi:hypothetical protein